MSQLRFYLFVLWVRYEDDIKDIGTKNETLAPQYSWIPSYSLTPILGASVLFGVALSMWLKK